MIFQILPPAERVRKSPLWRVGHGVDGKVPAGKVALDIRHEFHPVRVAVVPVAAFRAEGGDLHRAVLRDDGDGAVLLPCQHQPVIPENRFRLLRQGAGAQVVVVGSQPQTGIPNTAPHSVGGKAGIFQQIDAVLNIFG